MLPGRFFWGGARAEPRLPREEEKHPCLLPPLRQEGGKEEDLPLLTLQERYYSTRNRIVPVNKKNT